MPFTPIDTFVRYTQQQVHVSADEVVSMINDLMDLALEETESNLVQLKAELPAIKSTGKFALPKRRRQQNKKQPKSPKRGKKSKLEDLPFSIDEWSFGDQPQPDNNGYGNSNGHNVANVESNSSKNLRMTSGNVQCSGLPQIWDHSTQATMRYASSPLVDELELYGHLSCKDKKKNNTSGELIEIGSNDTSIPSTPKGESRRKPDDEKLSRKKRDGRGEINQLFSPSIVNLQVETPPLISPPISHPSTVQSPISAITTPSNESSLARSRCSPSLVSPISSMSLTKSPFSDDNRRNAGVTGLKDQASQTKLGSSGGRRQIVPKTLKSRSSVDEKRIVPLFYRPDQHQFSHHRPAVAKQLPPDYMKKSGGFSVNLNMVVRDPYTDAPYPMHFMIDCPNYEVGKVYVNGMAALSQNESGGSRQPMMCYKSSNATIENRKSTPKQH